MLGNGLLDSNGLVDVDGTGYAVGEMVPACGEAIDELGLANSTAKEPMTPHKLQGAGGLGIAYLEHLGQLAAGNALLGNHQWDKRVDGG